MMSTIFLSHFAGFLIFFCIMMFVFFDGMDLGIGILFPFLKNNKNRSVAMHSVHPFWDVNETWIVMAAVFLLTFFTSAYGIFISTFYIAVILLLGLIVLRGASFELGHKNEKHVPIWNWIFFASSAGISLVFGVFIGNLVVGLNIDSEMIYRGTFLELFNPISITSGITTALGFALIGGNWIAMKTEGELHTLACNIVKKVTKLLLLSSILLTILVFANENLRSIILSSPWRKAIIAWSIFANYSILHIIHQRRHTDMNNLLLSYLFALYGGIILVCITYPYIVPRVLDIYQPKFHPEMNGFSMMFPLMIMVLLIVLMYFFKNYRIFKGKIANSDIHY